MTTFLRTLIWFAIAAVAMLAAVWVAERPGNVTVEWRGWRLDTSAGALLLGAFAGLASFTAFTGLALGSFAFARRSACAAFKALRSSRSAFSWSDGDRLVPCENARLIMAR